MLGPLHQPFIGRQIKAARLVALAAGLVAIDATALEDRENILVEARGLPLLTAGIDNQGGRTQTRERKRCEGQNQGPHERLLFDQNGFTGRPANMFSDPIHMSQSETRIWHAMAIPMSAPPISTTY